ncbi:PREDICTED: disks large-associated protein 5 [Dipodomys ordii]|uniref:Disks large-associated protein 5 n=1 Tax=Dipodomys ordii TaxID=10020 RepID=A0A1S3ETC1_DIPOR|nr:PREDICTED: disks large-associated protein 5 [Dipodomys ordii]
MSSSRFASRHRKDLSTDMIRTKIAHRKSLSQKENRYKEYERNRHFGLKDVNIPTLGGRVLVNIDETAQDLIPETSIKTRSMKAIQSDERRQMLQKYKEEKQLKKLKEQREKAKQGVFKVGLYRPDTPCFLLTNQNALKAEGKKAIPSNVRITRSKAKDQMGQTKTQAREEILAQQCITYSTKTVQQDLKKLQCPLSSLPVSEEEHDLSKKEAITKNSNCLPIKEAPSLEINGGQLSQPQHDVPYFRQILQSETEKLTTVCLEWDRKLELDIPDDAKDLIRTAVGQTRLLMKERFKQFEGLVNDCEYKRGEKETTCTDLDGFWDMVTFQVEDVNQKFNNLTKLEESGWQNNNNNTSRKVIRKKIVSGIASKPKQDDGGRAAARNRLAAIKNAMRERIKQGEHADTVASVTPKEVDKIVFDAGFFRVESPVKSFSVLSSECSQRLGTPKSVSKVVPENRTEMDLLGQKPSPENPNPQSEHAGKKTLFSNIPESRDTIEDAQCSESEDVIEVNHGQVVNHSDTNEVNFEMYCVPSERMSLPLPSGVANDTSTNKEISDVVEEMELNSSVASQDVLMSSPEKNVSLQNTILKEAETSQSVLCDNRSLTTECHFLDSPGLNCGNLGTQMENRRQEHARHISFGGNLIAFSPLRPLSGE